MRLPPKPLDQAKIKQLSNKARAQERAIHLKWPTINNMVDMVRYLKYDRNGVLHLKTSTGVREFNVTHDSQDDDHIFVGPANGSLVPCGWFHLKDLEKALAADAITVKEEQ